MPKIGTGHLSLSTRSHWFSQIGLFGLPWLIALNTQLAGISFNFLASTCKPLSQSNYANRGYILQNANCVPCLSSRGYSKPPIMALALNMGAVKYCGVTQWFHILGDSSFPGRYARIACQYNLKQLRVKNNKEDKDIMQHLQSLVLLITKEFRAPTAIDSAC